MSVVSRRYLTRRLTQGSVRARRAVTPAQTSRARRIARCAPAKASGEIIRRRPSIGGVETEGCDHPLRSNAPRAMPDTTTIETTTSDPPGE